MARGSHSTDFCGIKLVRWGYRPRRAVCVYQGNYAVALNPNGSVAVSADSPFEYRHNDKPWLNRRLAEDLIKIKAISETNFRDHIKLCDAADLARKRRDAVDEIERAADIIGLRFTKAQRTKLCAAA